MRILTYLVIALVSVSPLASTSLCAAEEAADIALSNGQTVYVPGYSHIYGGDRERPVPLAVTVSIRNTDPVRAITLEAVDYYNSAGNLVKRYVAEPIELGMLASTRYVVAESDMAGGSGANFLVRWSAAKPVNVPIVEAIMIGTRGQQGISFTSRGQEIVPEHP